MMRLEVKAPRKVTAFVEDVPIKPRLPLEDEYEPLELDLEKITASQSLSEASTAASSKDDAPEAGRCFPALLFLARLAIS